MVKWKILRGKKGRKFFSMVRAGGAGTGQHEKISFSVLCFMPDSPIKLLQNDLLCSDAEGSARGPRRSRYVD